MLLLYYYFLAYKGWRGPCVRNNSTTHLLDRLAADYGQQCYEVPVGFKYVSAKMAETDALIGGESSGGMAVKGHIAGKDGIYGAALLVEMLAVTGKSVGQLCREIADRYGSVYYRESSCKMTARRKQELEELIFCRHQTPAFPETVIKTDWTDGCKLHFADGSWVICRFSGTEPLLRFAAEGNTPEQPEEYIQKWKSFLNL
jgi:phosphomannomutase